MMNLDFLVSDDKSEPLEILHADTKEPIGVTFFVVRIDSNAVFSSMSSVRDKALSLSANEEPVTADLMRETVSTQYAAAVTGWKSSNSDWDKNVGEYTPEKAKAIFAMANSSKSAASIMRQVGDFSKKIENFTKPVVKL